MSSHSCFDAQCKGDSNFQSLFIECSSCSDRMFLQCLVKNPGVSRLLLAMKILNSKGEPLMTKLVSINIHEHFKGIFSTESIIRIKCDKCKEEELKTKENNDKHTKTLIADLSKAQRDIMDLQIANKKLVKENRSKINEYTEIENENLNLHVKIASLESKLEEEFEDASDAKLLSSPKISSVQQNSDSATCSAGVKSNPVDNIIKPPNSNKIRTSIPTQSSETNEALGIYLTKFDPEIQCKNIAKYISSKTGITEDKFTVVRLLKSKVNMKHINFVSFKVTAHDQSTYEHVLNKEIWEPTYTAIPFNIETKKKEKIKKGAKPTEQIISTSTQTRDEKNNKSANIREKPIRIKPNLHPKRVSKPTNTHFNNMDVKPPTLDGSSVSARVPNMFSNLPNVSQTPIRYPHPYPIHQWVPYYDNNVNNNPVGTQHALQSNFTQGSSHMPPYRMSYPPMFQYYPHMYY